MYNTDNLGLCCGSVVQADFRGLAEAAGSAGFKSISMWPTLFEAALDSGLSVRDLRAILDDNGLHISELDPLMSWIPLELDPGDMSAAFYAYSEQDFYRMAEAIGGRTLNFIQYGEDNIGFDHKVDLVSALCERAAAHELSVSVEFLPFSPIGNLEQALELVDAVSKDNFGVNIDTWHHFRSGGTIEQLAAVDAGKVKAVQFNDVAAQPWDNLMDETATGRMVPGEGSSNSPAVLKALFTAGVDAPINVEVFSADLMALPAGDVAVKLMAAMKKVIEQAEAT